MKKNVYQMEAPRGPSKQMISSHVDKMHYGPVIISYTHIFPKAPYIIGKNFRNILYIGYPAVSYYLPCVIIHETIRKAIEVNCQGREQEHYYKRKCCFRNRHLKSFIDLWRTGGSSRASYSALILLPITRPGVILSSVKDINRLPPNTSVSLCSL